MWSMEPQSISFLVGAAYDQLPTTANLECWNLTKKLKYTAIKLNSWLRELMKIENLKKATSKNVKEPAVKRSN